MQHSRSNDVLEVKVSSVHWNELVAVLNNEVAFQALAVALRASRVATARSRASEAVTASAAPTGATARSGTPRPATRSPASADANPDTGVRQRTEEKVADEDR